MGLFGDLFDRAAEIDVHDAHAVFLDEPSSDFGHRLRVVVPDLDRQGSGFLSDSPESFGMFAVVLIEPDKASSVDHLGGLESGSTELPDDLTIGIIGIACHRGLENRRINLHRTDLDRLGCPVGRPIGYLRSLGFR